MKKLSIGWLFERLCIMIVHYGRVYEQIALALKFPALVIDRGMFVSVKYQLPIFVFATATIHKILRRHNMDLVMSC